MNVIEGRWQDVLPGSYDPARAVVVTDPPYGLLAATGAANSDPNGKRRGRGQLDTRQGHSTEKGYEDTIPWAEHVREVLALLPAKRHVIRGPATALIRRDFPQPRRVCVEMAAYRRRAANRPGVVPYLWQGWAVYGRLQLARHGTIGLAARTLGFDYLGAELVPEYAAVANEAFTTERLTLDLSA